MTPDLAIVDSVGTSRAGEISGIDAFTMIAVRNETGEWLWAGIRAALGPRSPAGSSGRAVPTT